VIRRLRSWRTVAAVGLVAAALLGISLLEGDVADDLTGFGSLVTGLLTRFGATASFVLLYIEESGVPLPVPGDVYVAYLGKVSAGSISNLLLAWLGIIVVVVGGATNLYLIARRFGPALLRRPFVRDVLGVDEARLERVRGWSKRWGALTIIFGRHVPGFRIPVTVLAATTGVRYRVFAPSVAISTAVWAAIGMWIGVTLGQSLGNLLARYPWIYLVGLGLIIVVVAAAVVRGWRQGLRSAPLTPLPDPRQLRQRLRESLKLAMSAHDSAAVAAIRSAMSAVDNAEAVDRGHEPAATDGIPGHVLLGVGAGEVARRELSTQDVLAIIQAEVSERAAAAAGYERIGRTEHASTLKAEAKALQSFLETALREP
jgi:membrane protein DedA with SNARE-associated domain/uncharacterized protein YqeY